MLDVIITTDPFDIDAYEHFETNDLISLITSHFEVWPENARIYAGNVAENCDVTPKDERDIERLKELDGVVYVVVYPGNPVLIILAVVVVLAIAAVIFLKPKTRDTDSASSSNNSLSDKGNKARPNSRIPDIYGKVRAIPDLIAYPYRIYDNNQEVEIAYMCVGRGSYEIEDVRDGDTLIGSIAGSGATFYGPGTSPNSGTPQLQIGSDIEQDLYDVVKVNEVNGQTLTPPNANSLKGNSNIRFAPPNLIQATSDIDFTEKFEEGQTITVTNADFGGSFSYITVSESARFYSDRRMEFETYNPSVIFTSGMVVTLANAIFTDGLTIDLSGTYIIDYVNSTTIGFV